MAATMDARARGATAEKTLEHRVVVSALRGLIVVLGFLSSAAPKHR
jgi:hypothetical protein